MRSQRSSPDLTPPTPATNLHPRAIAAFDCSEPQEITSIKATHVLDCPLPEINITHIDHSIPVNYTIVQSTGFRDAVGVRVGRVIYSLPQFCTTHSHQTMIVELLRLGVSKTVPLEDIIDMVKIKQFQADPSHIERIGMNQTKYYSYNSIGYTIALQTDYNCMGGNAWFMARGHKTGKSHSGVVVYVAEKLTVDQ